MFYMRKTIVFRAIIERGVKFHRTSMNTLLFKRDKRLIDL